jgi:molybdate transport system substrate-binding protein
VSTPEALKRALLAAKSIGHASPAGGSITGGHVQWVFRQLSIADEVTPKAHKISSQRRVAEAVASGDAAIGFQQISEILGVPGSELVGPLPEEIQQVTAFSAGMPVNAAQPEAAREFVAFLRSPAAWPAIRRMGLDPASEVGR